MASRAYQRAVIFGRSNGTTGNVLLISARTGFQDVTINGQRFYYNEKQTYNNINQVNLPALVNAASKRGQRGIVVISRKK